MHVCGCGLYGLATLLYQYSDESGGTLPDAGAVWTSWLGEGTFRQTACGGVPELFWTRVCMRYNNNPYLVHISEKAHI